MTRLAGKSALVAGPAHEPGRAFLATYYGKAPGQKKREVGAEGPCGRLSRAEDFRGMAVFRASLETASNGARTRNADGGNGMS